MKRYVTDREGNRIEHTGIKVWYVLCGTECKMVEWSWLIGPVKGYPNGLHMVDARGNRGNNPKSSTFFTRKAAIDDWRYHSKAEDAEHLDLIETIAEGMIKASGEARKKLRSTKPWQDL